MKKILSMLIVGLFTWLSFASADTVSYWNYQFTSDSDITTQDCDNGYWCKLDLDSDFAYWYEVPYYICWFVSSSSDLSSVKLTTPDWDLSISNLNQLYCQSVSSFNASYYWVAAYDGENPDESVSIAWLSLFSDSPITLVSSSNGWSEWWSIIGNTNAVSQWVISGVNSFTAWLWNIVPVLILLWLPILIVVLFRKKVWSYLKHFFSPR